LRKELKEPQGLLLEGSFEATMERLEELIQQEKPNLVISVGDVVSRNMIERGISVDVLVVDHKVMRKPVQPMEVDTDHTFHADNPAGTISDEAWNAIKRAVKQKGRTKVVIEGEEDLLTLITVLSAPKGSLVVYGQPHVGIVVVKVTEEVRENMRCIVESMEESSKS
jgi:uncharacterized protein (UPF0218 family)